MTYYTHPQEILKQKYRPDIDGLRAIAVLSVVGFHAFPLIFPGGFIGVDIFFVISGYLISGIIFGGLISNKFTFREFYSRRVRRIFPALLLIISFLLIFGWYNFLADEYKQLGNHIFGAAGFVSNFILWSESGYFDQSANAKPLLHLWSLGVEEQFYIVWPLALYFSYKKKINPLFLIIIIAFISFAYNIRGIFGIKTVDTAGLFYSPITRFWELLTGSLLAYITMHKQSLSGKSPLRFLGILDWLDNRFGTVSKNTRALTGIFLIILAVIVFNSGKVFPGWRALLPTLGAFLIVSAGEGAWFNRNVLADRRVVWFGLISYPLYMWHWPLLVTANMYGYEQDKIIRLFAVILSIILAWLTYRFLEMPIRHGKYGNVKVLTLCSMLFMLGFTGYGIAKNQGFSSRIPEPIRDLQQIPDLFTKTVLNDWREHRCFLDKRGDIFLPECDDVASAGPLMVVWGDSHAAALFSGFSRLKKDYRFRLAQYTTSACPPFNPPYPNLPLESVDNCTMGNVAILEKIKQLRPEVVLLHAEWGKGNYADMKNIRNTILELRKSGVRKIIVMGAVPNWINGLPKVLSNLYRKASFLHIPERINVGINEEVWLKDESLRLAAHDLQVDFVSARNILCNQQGCLAAMGKNNLDISSFDTGHLTPASAEFVARNLMKQIF